MTEDATDDMARHVPQDVIKYVPQDVIKDVTQDVIKDVPQDSIKCMTRGGRDFGGGESDVRERERGVGG